MCHVIFAAAGVEDKQTGTLAWLVGRQTCFLTLKNEATNVSLRPRSIQTHQPTEAGPLQMERFLTTKPLNLLLPRLHWHHTISLRHNKEPQGCKKESNCAMLWCGCCHNSHDSRLKFCRIPATTAGQQKNKDSISQVQMRRLGRLTLHCSCRRTHFNSETSLIRLTNLQPKALRSVSGFAFQSASLTCARSDCEPYCC